MTHDAVEIVVNWKGHGIDLVVTDVIHRYGGEIPDYDKILYTGENGTIDCTESIAENKHKSGPWTMIDLVNEQVFEYCDRPQFEDTQELG